MGSVAIFCAYERTIFGKVSANIKTIYKKYTSKDISEDDLLKLLLRIYVELFDIESGEEYEKTIKLILWNLIEVDVELFWRTFISKAVEYGANRRCLSQENLKEQCKSYFKENKTESNILTEPFWGRVWKEGCKDIEVQIDYVLAIPTQTTREEMSIEEDTIFYFELYRFDDSKKKDSLKYIAPNKMIWQNGLEFEVLFRCSSQERCGNYIEQELSKKLEDLENKYKVIAWPVKEHFPYTEVELLHKEVLEKSFESSKECRCANCGKAIFDDKVYIIEIDNEECKNTVGMAHETCVRPVDRIIGEANIPGIEDYSYLKHFDIDYWAKMVIKGKRVWENIELMAGFVDFFKNEVPADPMKAEYLIPTFIGELLAENKMSVKVLRSNDTWYGMTYKEDVVTVKESFEEMLKTEVYKEDLFSDL